jgi:hemolysin D
MSFAYRMQARWALARRYREVFAHFWTARHELDPPPHRPVEAEFLPEALALQVSPVSPVGRLVAYVLMGLTAAALAWATLGQVDIVVNATGRVIPSARTQAIAAVEVASVRAIHVRDGEHVHAGELLVELDASVDEAQRTKAEGALRQARLQAARARAMLASLQAGHRLPMAPVAGSQPVEWQAEERHFIGQYEDFAAKLSAVDGEIRHYADALPLASQQEDDYEALTRTHDVAEHAYLQKKQMRVDLESALRDARNRREELVAETRRTALDAASEGERLADDAAQDVARTSASIRLLKLVAPVDGTVQQSSVFTVGGVVPAAQTLMQIVPDDKSVEIEATLKNRDAGFVEAGQPVAVKVAAYDYTKYGTAAGTVARVAHDSTQDDKHDYVYTVSVGLPRPTMRVDGREVALSPGLDVDLEIKTGRQRVIEYLLSPLIRHEHESLHER